MPSCEPFLIHTNTALREPPSALSALQVGPGLAPGLAMSTRVAHGESPRQIYGDGEIARPNLALPYPLQSNSLYCNQITAKF
jgi:hypothetical protein